MRTKTEIIAEAFKMLRAGMIAEAKVIISENYPFKPQEKEVRTYRKREKIKIFLRDGMLRQNGNILDIQYVPFYNSDTEKMFFPSNDLKIPGSHQNHEKGVLWRG